MKYRCQKCYVGVPTADTPLLCSDAVTRFHNKKAPKPKRMLRMIDLQNW